MKRAAGLGAAALAGALAAASFGAPLLARTGTSSPTDLAPRAASLADPTPARPGALAGELANVGAMVGADDAWARGLDGRGIGVALIDSGVTPVRGLDTSDAVVPGPDFTPEALDPSTRNLDGAGHGTHLAGIIAGRPIAADGAAGDFTGVAPGARVISLKVADANEATDPAAVVAALRWVVQHAHDPGLDIRIVNLSFGVDGLPAASADAVRAAVADAVSAGLVVVAAAGNDGPNAPVTSPASSPDVLAVGATDPSGSVATDDDVVAPFSNLGNGPDARHPDLLAPGRSLVSLLAPGAAAGRDNPGSVVDGSLIKGSGTSQAAAVVSGAAALVLQDRPWLTPAQVKDVLVRSAAPLAQDPSGRLLDVGAALDTTPRATATTTDRSEPSTVDLRPAIDLSGITWSGITWSGITWSGITWSGITWSGITWSGITWSGITWSGITWSGITWSGITWSGITWSGITWSGITWSGITWSGITWSGITWSGITWS